GRDDWRWTGHRVDATALALRAFLAVDPSHELTRKAATWLALNRDGGHWVSTRQTAMAVLAMADYLAAAGEASPDLTIRLSCNGELVYERKVDQESLHEFPGTTTLPVRAGDNEIVIEKEGTGTPVYSAYLRYFRQADAFAPSEGPIRVARAYSRVLHAGGERKVEPLPDGAAVASGDEVEVTLRVRADRAHEYLMIEDPLPAGFEAVREERVPYGRWEWWYSRKEFRDDKVALAVTRLGEGEWTASYTMRAETPGEYRALPAVVWNMYRPQEGANSGGSRLNVTDR
ncbi:MAG: hypothetical protein ACREID_03840, partial [Planctomycetota bacterium]